MSSPITRNSDRAQPELSVYDGQTRVGAIRRRDGRFVALDAQNRELGRFETLRGAMRAVPAAETNNQPYFNPTQPKRR
jgi:hypothetical protein